MKNVNMNDVITFGKYKGETWKNVWYEYNMSYFRWCETTVGIVFPTKETQQINDVLKRHEKERLLNHAKNTALPKIFKFSNKKRQSFSTGDIHTDYDLGLCGQY